MLRPGGPQHLGTESTGGSAHFPTTEPATPNRRCWSTRLSEVSEGPRDLHLLRAPRMSAPKPHCTDMALPLPAGGHPGPRLPRRGPGAVGQLPARPLFLGIYGDSRGLPSATGQQRSRPQSPAPLLPPTPALPTPIPTLRKEPSPSRDLAGALLSSGCPPPPPGEAWTAKGRCGTQDAAGTEREATTHHGANWAWGSQTPKLTLDRLSPGKPLHIGGHFSCGQRGEEGDADQRQGASRALVCKTGDQCCRLETRTARPRPPSRGPESPGHTRHRGRGIHVRKRGAASLNSARNHTRPPKVRPLPWAEHGAWYTTGTQ